MTDDGKQPQRIEYLLIEEATRLIEHVSMALPDARKKASIILNDNGIQLETDQAVRGLARHELIKQLIEFLNQEVSGER